MVSIIKTDPENDENLVADKETKVSIISSKNGEDEAGLDELTSLFNRFRITNDKEEKAEQIKFVGFKE